MIIAGKVELGTYKVTVKGTSVLTNKAQPFALVVTGGFRKTEENYPKHAPLIEYAGWSKKGSEQMVLLGERFATSAANVTVALTCTGGDYSGGGDDDDDDDDGRRRRGLVSLSYDYEFVYAAAAYEGGVAIDVPSALADECDSIDIHVWVYNSLYAEVRLLRFQSDWSWT